MSKRRLKNAGRRKAPFGSEAAAILTAAGINAATQMAAAAIGSRATQDSANRQAEAMKTSAEKQSQAIKEQTERSKEYQQQSQDFIREQNQENRDIQRDMQMQLQMAMGQQNVNDRYEASRIAVKNGGNAKRKLRKAGQLQFLLRGSDNIPFTVTDGGGVIPLGTTPEGFDLYEIYGNDHEHYHKAQGGKNKTGVGIKFANGNVIEGEGNQNTSRGEKLLVTPNDALFISKHSLKGFNPAKAVDNGMNPLEAYALQEQIKNAYGISDDGSTSSPVRKANMGLMVADDYDYYNQSTPINTDIIPVAIAANSKRLLRCGGRVRTKAPNGVRVWNWGNNGSWNNDGTWNYGDKGRWSTINTGGIKTFINSAKGRVNSLVNNGINLGRTAISASTPANNTVSSGPSWISRNADLVGAGITGLGNIGGAIITNIGNRRAANTLSDAYNYAADTMAEAYRNLQTIDMNSIRREDYAAAHAMPALQAPVSFAATQNAAINRGLQRRLSNAGKYSASGAAAYNRMAGAEIDAQDMRNKVYSTDQQQMQQIRQANAERVTQAAMKNAELDTQANREYNQGLLNLLQYNNDIENEKILGSAGALSEGAVNSANAIAQARTSNAAAWAQSLIGSSQGFSNALTNMATRKADLEKVRLGASGDTNASYFANSGLTTNKEAKDAYDAYVRQYENAIDEDTKKIYKRRANTIASARGFKLV